MASPRAELTGTASLATDGGAVAGENKNISVSGMFVATAQPLFRIGDQISVAVESPDLMSPFSAQAEVVRFNVNRLFQFGYGLRFLGIDNKAITDIARLVGPRPISEFGALLSNPHQRPG